MGGAAMGTRVIDVEILKNSCFLVLFGRLMTQLRFFVPPDSNLDPNLASHGPLSTLDMLETRRER